MYTVVYRCVEVIYRGVHRCTQVCTGDTGVYSCIQVCTGVHRCVEVIQVCTGVVTLLTLVVSIPAYLARTLGSWMVRRLAPVTVMTVLPLESTERHRER